MRPARYQGPVSQKGLGSPGGCIATALTCCLRDFGFEDSDTLEAKGRERFPAHVAREPGRLLEYQRKWVLRQKRKTLGKKDISRRSARPCDD